MHRLVAIVGIGGVLAGLLGVVACEERATDVGNPTLSPPTSAPAPATQSPGPAVEQLAGDYTVADTSVCQSDATAKPAVSLTTDPRQLILQDFFAYSAGTAQITATYDAAGATLSFTMADEVVDMTCTGPVTTASDKVTITLRCTLKRPIVGNCTSMFFKAS